MTALAAEMGRFDMDAAHMEAHRWVEIARPLIKAYLALDQIHADVLSASYGAGVYSYSVKGSADDLSRAVGRLHDDIEGIRDAVIADVGPRQPSNSAAWDAYDDLCEGWEERIRDVLSVDAAIQREARK